VLFSEDAEKFIDAEVEKTELRVGVSRQVEHHQSVAVAHHALDAEVVDRRHLRRDVVVLEMFSHLGESAATPEAEEGAARRRERGEGRAAGRGGRGRRVRRRSSASVVDVDDALATHAEREAAVLVQHAVARQRTLGKSSRVYEKHEHRLRNEFDTFVSSDIQ